MHLMITACLLRPKESMTMKLQLQEHKINVLVMCTCYFRSTCMSLHVQMRYRCQLTSSLSLGLPPRSSAVCNIYNYSQDIVCECAILMQLIYTT